MADHFIADGEGVLGDLLKQGPPGMVLLLVSKPQVAHVLWWKVVVMVDDGCYGRWWLLWWMLVAMVEGGWYGG